MRWFIINWIVLLTSVPAVHSAAPGKSSSFDLLLKIANYTSRLDVGTNSLSNDTVHFDASGGTDHIFVNGNLARVLLSTYRLQQKRTGHGNRDYLDQALGWCDTFAVICKVHWILVRKPCWLLGCWLWWTIKL